MQPIPADLGQEAWAGRSALIAIHVPTYGQFRIFIEPIYLEHWGNCTTWKKIHGKKYVNFSGFYYSSFVVLVSLTFHGGLDQMPYRYDKWPTRQRFFTSGLKTTKQQTLLAGKKATRQIEKKKCTRDEGCQTNFSHGLHFS